MFSFFTVLLFICAAYLFTSIRIANENERFAVITLGRFTGIKGPGLVLHTPHVMKIVRVGLGAEGQIQSDTLVVIGGNAIPFVSSGRIRPGMKVRVSGFETNALRVEASEQIVVCEKCGHKNVLESAAS